MRATSRSVSADCQNPVSPPSGLVPKFACTETAAPIENVTRPVGSMARAAARYCAAFNSETSPITSPCVASAIGTKCTSSVGRCTMLSDCGAPSGNWLSTRVESATLCAGSISTCHDSESLTISAGIRNCALGDAGLIDGPSIPTVRVVSMRTTALPRNRRSTTGTSLALSLLRAIITLTAAGMPATNGIDPSGSCAP